MNKSVGVVIVFFLLVNVICVWSSPRLTHLMNKRDVFCGPKLTDAIALVCQGNYNSPTKKSMNDLLNYNEYNELFQNDENQVDFPLFQKELESFMPMRFRRGIVDECCKKPCTLKHLALYCAG